jgi:hypothetical protein
MSAPVTCRHCGETFTTTGTKNGQDAATWEYLEHLRDNHGED